MTGDVVRSTESERQENLTNHSERQKYGTESQAQAQPQSTTWSIVGANGKHSRKHLSVSAATIQINVGAVSYLLYFSTLLEMTVGRPVNRVCLSSVRHKSRHVGTYYCYSYIV